MKTYQWRWRHIMLSYNRIPFRLHVSELENNILKYFRIRCSTSEIGLFVYTHDANQRKICAQMMANEKKFKWSKHTISDNYHWDIAVVYYRRLISSKENKWRNLQWTSQDANHASIVSYNWSFQMQRTHFSSRNSSQLTQTCRYIMFRYDYFFTYSLDEWSIHS